MPQSCAVPFCPERKGGHKFPKDETVSKQWLVAIRRDNFTPSKHSRVCKKHFNPDDYALPKESCIENPTPKLKPKAVPSRFSWNCESEEQCCQYDFPKKDGGLSKKVKNDMENYVEFKLVGGNLKLKKGIVPHKFACQEPSIEKPEHSVVKTLKTTSTSSNECVASTSHNIEEIYIADSIPHVQDIVNDPSKDEKAFLWKHQSAMASVCRICLVGNRRMLDVDNIHLLEMYETLTNTKLNTETVNGMPMPSTVCYLCYQQLQKCHDLSQMAHKSNGILQDMLKCGIEATQETISTLPLELKEKLSSTPTQHMFKHIIEYAHIESTPLITIKEEPVDRIVVKEETYETLDIEELQTHDEDNEIGNECNDMNNSDMHIIEYAHIESTPLITIKEEPVDRIVVKEETYETLDIEVFQTHDEDNEIGNECNDMNNSELPLNNDISPKNETTGTKSHTCNTCGKAFGRRGTLNKHMLVHSDEKAHFCNSCGKSFKQKCTLNKHMRIHTGERSYSCNSCPRTYHRKESLKKHMQIHNGEKPYSCNCCDKVFTQKVHLNRHMLLHTGAKPYS